ncbi:MAG: hypothetical protein CMJ24_06940 [Phycisphaerae bacterium]|jgi:hypothetical protein|nr:hypothetical protein [Phycisphaerae bacterium]MDG1898575.1 hypothetical protein [Phycisphaerales bacterium]|tara:strand:- start:2222 stop:2506 length:285 start_codon:yes stop_codon:yes gene_type:complete
MTSTSPTFTRPLLLTFAMILSAFVGALLLGGMDSMKEDKTVVGISCVPTASGANVVIYRLWSTGGIDRRLVQAVGSTPEDILTHQNGWRIIQTP